jgi:hypothetical protein
MRGGAFFWTYLKQMTAYVMCSFYSLNPGIKQRSKKHIVRTL